MTIFYKTWLKHTQEFSNEEKESLNKAITGEIICPRGIVVDETKLSYELKSKISKLLTN